MKVILVGYPGSQFLVPASKYLAEKYLPGFDLHYLNWMGLKPGWSGFVAKYLKELTDKYVIFALDDYLIEEPINMPLFQDAMSLFVKDPDTACVKLCETNYEEHKSYPVTTQFTVWDREFLISLLEKTEDPWHFEIVGSSLYRETGRQSIFGTQPVLKYDVHSALSSRWQGINWGKVKQEDLDYIKNNNLIT